MLDISVGPTRGLHQNVPPITVDFGPEENPPSYSMITHGLWEYGLGRFVVRFPFCPPHFGSTRYFTYCGESDGRGLKWGEPETQLGDGLYL